MFRSSSSSHRRRLARARLQSHHLRPLPASRRRRPRRQWPALHRRGCRPLPQRPLSAPARRRLRSRRPPATHRSPLPTRQPPARAYRLRIHQCHHLRRRRPRRCLHQQLFRRPQRRYRRQLLLCRRASRHRPCSCHRRRSHNVLCIVCTEQAICSTEYATRTPLAPVVECGLQ